MRHLSFLLAYFLISLSQSIKIIFLFAPCREPITHLLHLLRMSVGRHLAIQDNYTSVHFRNRDIRHMRHDLSDACYWVSEGTIAIFAVTSRILDWKGLDTTAHDFHLPHFVINDTCAGAHCPNPIYNSSASLEQAVFDYLRNEYLFDVIILHENKDQRGYLLSSLLNDHSVLMSHISVDSGKDFLKHLERYYSAFNLVDLSDVGRFLISLTGGYGPSDQLLQKMLLDSMHNLRTRILVADSPRKWEERLQEITSYEVDLVVVSVEPATPGDCPTAIEVLPLGLHDHKNKPVHTCSVLSPEMNKLGESILEDIQHGLSTGQCCLKEDSYTVWRSYPAENGTQHLRPVAVWGPMTGLLLMDSLDLGTITLRIAVIQYRPYIVLNETGGETTLGKCVLKEILQDLSKNLHFKYRLVRIMADDWGSKAGNKWTGAIGMIHRGEIDLIPYLTMTPSRYEAVEYTKPLTTVEYGILVQFPQETPRAFIFVRLYQKEVWLTLLFSAIVVSFVMSQLHLASARFLPPNHVQKHLSSFFRSLWLIFGALLEQGGTHLPGSASGRVLLSTWWLAVMVISTTYSANLIALLAFPDIRWVTSNLQEMVQHDSLTMAIKKGCPVMEDLQESEVEIFRDIRRVYFSNPQRFRLLGYDVRRTSIINTVSEGQTVYIDDLNYLSRMVENDYINQGGQCRVTIAPGHFSSMELAMGLRRGSSLLHPINEEVQRMKESGVLRHWYSRYSPQREECYSIDAVVPGQRAVDLEDLQGPFYLLSIGLVLGILLFCMEWMVQRILRFIHLKRKLQPR